MHASPHPSPFRLFLIIALLLSAATHPRPAAASSGAIAASRERSSAGIPSPASKLSSALQARLAASSGAIAASTERSSAGAIAASTERSSAGAMVPVIVMLSGSADLEQAARNGTGAAPQERVIRALHAHAEAAQKKLESFFTDRRYAGQFRQVTPFWVINALSVQATLGLIQALAARPDVERVELVETLQAPTMSAGASLAASGAPAAEGAVAPSAAASTSTPGAWDNLARINAPAVWDLGFRGQGVVVAGMDTGVDYAHPELRSAWRGGGNSWFDPYGRHAAPADLPPTCGASSGHGTATTSVMVGGSVGVAPRAQWIAVKIFDDNCQADTAHILLGFQWLLDPDQDPATADAPQVVNNSWGGKNCDPSLAFQEALRALRAAGILPVFSAGNAGPGAETIAYPGNYAEAFPVGATDSQDVIASFSSRGPNTCVQPAVVSPALSAPGVAIDVALPGGGYTLESGTSFAAPHVAGALALLLSALPQGISLDQQIQALQNSAQPLGASPSPNNDYGWGRLDVLAALQWLLPSKLTFSGSPGSIPESGGQFTFFLTLNPPSNLPVTVSFAPAAPAGLADTAVDGIDYTLPGQVTFQPGETQKAVAVGILNNTLPQPDRAIAIKMVSPVNAIPAAPTQTLNVTIRDDDPQVGFAAGSQAVNETAGSVAITVTRAGGVSYPVSVAVAFSGGTAIPGVDYLLPNPILYLGPGETVQALALQILPDPMPGPDKTLTLSLSNLPGGTLDLSPGQTTLTIRNTDPWLTWLPVIRH